MLLLLLGCFCDNIARWSMLFEKLNHKFMRHAIVTNKRLTAVLGDVGAVDDRTRKRRLHWQLLCKVVLEVLVTQVLVKSIP